MKKNILTVAIQDELSNYVKSSITGYNPYVKKSILYYVGKVPHYVFANNVYTQEELDREYYATATRDAVNGYKDRYVGYYDKWYRYNHADDGFAYDLGVKFATSKDGCAEYMNIIEA